MGTYAKGRHVQTPFHEGHLCRVHRRDPILHVSTRSILARPLTFTPLSEPSVSTCAPVTLDKKRNRPVEGSKP